MKTLHFRKEYNILNLAVELSSLVIVGYLIANYLTSPSIDFMYQVNTISKLYMASSSFKD